MSYEEMKEMEIRAAYVFLRTNNQSIPSETLDFMLNASLEKLKQEKNLNIDIVSQRYTIEDIERCVENWGLCKVEKEYIERFLNGG